MSAKSRVESPRAVNIADLAAANVLLKFRELIAIDGADRAIMLDQALDIEQCRHSEPSAAR